MRLTGIPWTLWRHVAWELLRMFVVTTSVIVTVIAFGAAAKPLADNTIGADTSHTNTGKTNHPVNRTRASEKIFD